MVYGDNEGIGRRGYRVGNPLRIAFANDFFRPVQGTYGVMELQPGQVNWGSINPQPLPGAVRLWLWSVFAGGSDFICTYRYRQPLYGTEQYHYGIVNTDGTTITPGGREFEQFIKEVKQLRTQAKARDVKPADYQARRTAILFNHENAWSIERQKQNRTWNTMAHIDKYYRTLKSFGAPVDIINESKDLSQYPVVIAPAYQMADKALADRWNEYVRNGGNLVLTCRTAQKDRYGRLPEAPFGSLIYDLTGNEMEFYEGKPAITTRKLGKGTITYIGIDSTDGTLERDVLKKLYAKLNIPVMDLPYGVTIEYRNGLGIVLNYSDKPYNFTLPEGAKALIGTTEIPTAGVLVFALTPSMNNTGYWNRKI